MYPLLGNMTSTHDESSSSQPHHPHHDYNSSYFQDHDGVVLSYLLSQQLDTDSSQSADISVAASNQGLIMEEEKIQSSKKKRKAAAAPRKRSSGKKDRHSKIYTAQGPRDRRMRLSVQIARKFFDLQDMLGFDKASKTIDWLFTKSRSAINELKQQLVLRTCSTINSLSTSAESNEVVSQTMQDLKSDSSIGRMINPRKNIRRYRVGKGSRDQARARARERTRQKLRIRLSCQANHDEANPKDLGLLCLGEEAEKHTNHELIEQDRTNSMMRNNADDHKTLMGRSISATSRARFEDDGCEFPGFTGNWGNKMQSIHPRKMTRNVTESFTGNNLLQVENPSTPIMGLTSKYQEPSSTTTSRLSFNSSNSQEQSYSGTYSNSCPINFMPNQDHNPNSIFIATLISPDQNPGQFLKFN